MEYSSSGFLELHAYTAGEALPIPNINFRISGGEEANRGTDYSVISDRNGDSPVITLPAPSLSFSLTPNAQEQAYSLYDVEVSGQGFYPQKLIGITVFPDILSILRIELVPDGELRRSTSPPQSDNVIEQKEELQ